MIGIIMGPPGAGKGAQSERLVADLGFVHLSSGDLFRKAIAADTPLGRVAHTVLAKGKLMPDDVATELVTERIGELRGAKILLDGFPRTLPQARSLDRRLESLDETVTIVAWLEVPEEMLLSRIAGRVIDPRSGAIYNLVSDPPPPGVEVVQRIDDTPAAVTTRLREYIEMTEPVFRYYQAKGIALRVDGVGTFDEVHARLAAAFYTREKASQAPQTHSTFGE